MSTNPNFNFGMRNQNMFQNNQMSDNQNEKAQLFQKMKNNINHNNQNNNFQNMYMQNNLYQISNNQNQNNLNNQNNQFNNNNNVKIMNNNFFQNNNNQNKNQNQNNQMNNNNQNINYQGSQINNNQNIYNNNKNDFIKTLHIPKIDKDKSILCNISHQTPNIDKNETNEIKSMIQLLYSNFGRNREKLSSKLSEEIKNKLGGEWFVFVSKKNNKIQFNIATISESDYLVIDIGNSVFKIAKMK